MLGSSSARNTLRSRRAGPEQGINRRQCGGTPVKAGRLAPLAIWCRLAPSRALAPHAGLAPGTGPGLHPHSLATNLQVSRALAQGAGAHEHLVGLGQVLRCREEAISGCLGLFRELRAPQFRIPQHTCLRGTVCHHEIHLDCPGSVLCHGQAVPGLVVASHAAGAGRARMQLKGTVLSREWKREKTQEGLDAGPMRVAGRGGSAMGDLAPWTQGAASWVPT